jgi:dephospho-CoA kinase
MKLNDRPLQIGITGGIGSGKTLICNIFQTFGIPVYDADSRAKWIMNQHEELRNDIIAIFGPSSYTSSYQLNRKYLAEQVFNDSNKVALLNSLVHPRVGEDYAAWVQLHVHHPYVMKEAALLFESGSYRLLHKVITVFAPPPIRIQRITTRDPQRTEQEILAIIGKQMNEEEKLQKADYIIYNDESHLVIPQVLDLHHRFLAMDSVGHTAD